MQTQIPGVKNAARAVFKSRLEKCRQKGNLYAREASLHRALQQVINAEINARRLQNKAAAILFYFPLNTEFSTKKLLNCYKKSKKVQIFLPFMEKQSFKAVKFRLPLKAAKFGVFEPHNSHFYKSSLTLAVVPVLGVDGDFRRIGFGKGMYDRFFSNHKKPKIIFTSRTLNIAPSGTCEHFDAQGQIYVTPFATFIKDKNDNMVNRNFARQRGYRWRRQLSNLTRR